MYVLTHIIVVYVNVWAPVSLSECEPQVVCNRDAAVQTPLHRYRNVSFHSLIVLFNLQQMRDENVHRVSEFSDSYSDLVIHLLKSRVVSEGTVMLELTSFICTTTCIREFESQY